MSTRIIVNELKQHAPFTAFGTLTGIVLMAALVQGQVSRETTAGLFWACHPAHVFLSALVTTAMYRLHGNKGFWKTLAIGYFGSVGIATLSDSIMATDKTMDAVALILTGLFLFLAVWIPCCASDIIFSLLFSKERKTDE